MALAALSLFAAGWAGQNWQMVRAWMFAEWTHWGFVAGMALCLGAFLAGLELERELDELKLVRIVMEDFKAEFRDFIKFNHGAESNVVFIQFTLRLRNDARSAQEGSVP